MADGKITHLLDESEMDRLILNIAEKIISEGADDIALVGIKTRGVPIAKWLEKKMESLLNRSVPVGVLDISLYRDDLSEIDEQPVVRKSEMPFTVTGKGVILIDDVLYTGRTIRAAMDAIMDYGRPKFVRLMVMIDRGWRELPIQADYAAKTIKTTANQNVKVKLKDTDGVNEVVVKG